ncbi:MAG: TRAP transporter TatT component family protein [Spirochaetaceae bacterium]
MNRKSQVVVRIAAFTLAVGAVLVLSSCSINRMATRMTANALTSEGGSTAFASDEDPELVADALPFGLKMYESLLAQLPEHEGLLLTSAEGFVSYAHGFIFSPSQRLSHREGERKKEMRQRAQKMYIRGRDYALDLLELRYPGFKEAVREEEFAENLLQTEEEDVEALYWAAAGWMGAISTAGLDLSMIMELTKPVALMARAFELKPDYNDGAIHTFLIQIYGAVPDPSMLYGTTETGGYVKEVLEGHYKKNLSSIPEGTEGPARYHMMRAIDLSKGELAAPYIAFAGSFSVDNQDAAEYQELLEKALAIDPENRPEDRLANILDQRTAEWMLEQIEEKFITYENSDD